MRSLRRSEAGSATVWVLACCVLVLVVALAAALRATAVLARHRAESAADLAALAAAGQIGRGEQMCAAAQRIAVGNGATLRSCVHVLATDGRSGTVVVSIDLAVRLPVLGDEHIYASAQAGRDAAFAPP